MERIISLSIADKITGVRKETEGGQYSTINPKVHFNIMHTQMNIKQGRLDFGEKGNEAVLKELRQLHVKKALMPLQLTDMTNDKRKKALRYLMILKEK